VAAHWFNCFGDNEEAGELLKGALARAMAMPEPALCLRRVLSAMCSTGKKLLEKQAYEMSRSLLELTLRFIVGFPNHEWVSALRADVLGCLGQLQAECGDRDGAVASWVQAAKHEGECYGLQSAQRAATLEKLAGFYVDRCTLRLGLEMYEEVLPIMESLYGSNSPQVTRVLGNIGAVAFDTADFARAQVEYEKALALAKEGPPLSLEVAEQYHNLGLMHTELGHFKEAYDHFHKAVTIRKEICSPTGTEVAATYTCLGILSREQGDLEKARESLELALEMEAAVQNQPESMPGTTHLAAVAQHHLGMVDSMCGYLDIAEQRFFHALSVQEALFGVAAQCSLESLSEIGVLRMKQGRFAEADSFFQRAVAVVEPGFGQDSYQVAMVYRHMGESYHAEGRLAEARSYLEKALAIRTAVFGSQSRQVAASLVSLGDLLISIGEEEGAAAALARALQIQTQVYTGPHAEAVMAPTRAVIARLGDVDLSASGDWEVVQQRMQMSLSQEWEVISPNSGAVSDLDSDWQMVKDPKASA